MREKKTASERATVVAIEYNEEDVYTVDDRKLYPVQVIRKKIGEKSSTTYNRFVVSCSRGFYNIEKHFGIEFIPVEHPVRNERCSVLLSFADEETKAGLQRTRKKKKSTEEEA